MTPFDFICFGLFTLSLGVFVGHYLGYIHAKREESNTTIYLPKNWSERADDRYKWN
jgi:hypothetical protein